MSQNTTHHPLPSPTQMCKAQPVNTQIHTSLHIVLAGVIHTYTQARPNWGLHSPFLEDTCTGTISLSKWPAFCACSALFWDTTATLSWASLLTCHFLATFSAEKKKRQEEHIHELGFGR